MSPKGTPPQPHTLSLPQASSSSYLNRYFFFEDGQQAHEKMLRLSSPRGNANQNHMRHHFTSRRMAVIKKTDNNKCWQEIGTILHCWQEYKMEQPLGKTVWQLLKELNVKLPYDPGILFLAIYIHPRELKTYV